MIPFPQSQPQPQQIEHQITINNVTSSPSDDGSTTEDERDYSSGDTADFVIDENDRDAGSIHIVQSYQVNPQEEEDQVASIADLGRYSFDPSKFSGEIVAEEIGENTTLKLYKNNDKFPISNINSKFHTIPIIFYGNSDVYFCKKHCEQVLEIPNLHTSLARKGYNCFTLKGHDLKLYKKIMLEAQKLNSVEGLTLNFSMKSQRISFVSGTDLSLCLKATKNVSGMTKEEELFSLSSPYSHNLILHINGAGFE